QFAPSYRTPSEQPPVGAAQTGGVPPQGPVPPPPEPKKRSWFARHKILTALLAVVVLVIAVQVFSGGSDPATDGDPAASQEEAGEAEGADAADTADEQDAAQADEAGTDEAGPVEATEDAEEVDEAEPAGRDNSTAEQTTLGAGTFTVGEDVPPGRYVIEPGAGQSGNLSASSEEDPLAINEILGGEVGFGVPSVTSTLIEGEQLEISGLSEVTFTPAETELRSTLTAGDWVVGLDIAAGDYVATPADGETGNFVVYDDWGLPATNEILGEDDGFSVPEVTVSLADGDEIEISGLSEVTFTSK
ncbi:MAG TPA: hypothetical protein VK060_04940, partial [Ruania sp.]|nr:hypothetical protein [Ruania sp.]